MYKYNNGSFEHIDDELLIGDSLYQMLYSNNEEAIRNGWGKLVLENGVLSYKEERVRIAVNRKDHTYYQVGNNITSYPDDYLLTEISVKEYKRGEGLKADPNNVVLYDNGIIYKTIDSRFQYYDYTNGVIKIDKEKLAKEILGSDWSLDTMIKNIRERGFKITVNGETFYQPFRDMEDRLYFTTLLSYEPKYRMMKLFYEGRNRDRYKVMKGASITNEFINSILKMMAVYNFYLKEVAEEVFKLTKSKTEKEDLLFFKNNYIDSILQIIKSKYMTSADMEGEGAITYMEVSKTSADDAYLLSEIRRRNPELFTSEVRDIINDENKARDEEARKREKDLLSRIESLESVVIKEEVTDEKPTVEANKETSNTESRNTETSSETTPKENTESKPEMRDEKVSEPTVQPSGEVPKDNTETNTESKDKVVPEPTLEAKPDLETGRVEVSSREKAEIAPEAPRENSSSEVATGKPIVVNTEFDIPEDESKPKPVPEPVEEEPKVNLEPTRREEEGTVEVS